MVCMASTPAVAAAASESSPVDAGTWLVIFAGLALTGYGFFFIVRNFTGFIELGLTPAHVGGTPEAIRSFSPQLYNYISHLQVAIAGFIIALGVAVISLAWNGMRHGMRWAAWTVLVVVVMATAITLPLHYVYGLATFGHLGPLYVDVALLVAGSVLSLRARNPALRRSGLEP
jgi:hypothetical protein